MERHTEALTLMDECVQLRKRVLGANHPYFLNSSAALSEWRLKAKADASSGGAYKISSN